MSGAAPKPFTFETVFDGENVIAAVRPKRAYTPEEFDAARKAAFEEGERSAVAQAEAAAAEALAATARAAGEALAGLAALTHTHREAAAALAMSVGEKIAGAALLAFPEAPIGAALRALEAEFQAVPRLVVNVAAADRARLEAALRGVAAEVGFEGQIVFRADPALKGAAFVLDWGDGRASFDPEAVRARVGEALRSALKAEAMTLQSPASSPAPEPDL